MINQREEHWLGELAEETKAGRLHRRNFLRISASAGIGLATAAAMIGLDAGEATAAAGDLKLKKPEGFELPKHNYLLDKESPFEVKNVLIDKAQKAAAAKGIPYINVGRGNPDFLNTTVRHAFAQIVHFSAQAAKDQDPAADYGYRVPQKGLAQKLKAWLKAHRDEPGTEFLEKALAHLQKLTGGDPDELAFQVVDAANGDFYPDPSRILPFNETAVRAYMDKVLFRGKPPKGEFHLFATEGATASMVYIFLCLMESKVLKPGDKIAIFTPIFSPYLEVPRLSDFGLEPVYIPADSENGWHVDQEALKKTLKDPNIKALYLINPANPGAVTLSEETVNNVVDIVKNDNPNLMVINDTVYANFTKEFRTLSTSIPENTIGCYSYSKYYGVTGWRLGMISIYETCIVDKLLAELPEADKQALRQRYSIVSTDPDKIPFHERLEIESRFVALAHTGGLSCPQQVIMSLFSLFEVLDEDNSYNKTVTGVIHERWDALYAGLETPPRTGDDLTRYYAIVELDKLASKRHGEKFSAWLLKQWDLGFLFHLSEDHGVVCLPGDGFAGPAWSIRVALANQTKEDCNLVGKAIVDVVDTYHTYWSKSA